MVLFVVSVLTVITGSALCSGSETALLSVPMLRARQLAEGGGKRARALLAIEEEIARPISAIVVLNNVFNIVGSIFVGDLLERFRRQREHLMIVPTSMGVVTLEGRDRGPDRRDRRRDRSPPRPTSVRAATAGGAVVPHHASATTHDTARDNAATDPPNAHAPMSSMARSTRSGEMR